MKSEPRQSNFELLRIVAMFFIVLHHYVWSSGVLDVISTKESFNHYWLLASLGAWGKTMINPFVMLSGFFMCTSRLTAKRFLKIFLEWMFYSIAIYGIFLLTGRETGSPSRVFGLIFSLFADADKSFTPSFMWFYLGIPIYNLVIKGLDKKGLYCLTGGLLALFILPLVGFENKQVFHHVFWYMTLYFVGACIRLYPFRWMSRQIVIVPILVGYVLVGIYGIRAEYTHWESWQFWYYVCGGWESSCLLSFVLGTMIFLFFKNLNVGYRPLVNKVASCMFGVLCIHAASDAMRLWLWRDVCRVPMMAVPSPIALWQFALHAVGCVVAIMVVCVLIDLARQKWIESPVFKKMA